MRQKDSLFEVARRTFDTPEFRGITFIESEAKTIINHVPGNAMPFSWTINPYRGCSHACTYCFARVTHTYMDMSAGKDFETKIVVKINAPDVLRAQLRSRRWHGDHIAMGTATDPYQRAEGRFGAFLVQPGPAVAVNVAGREVVSYVAGLDARG